MQTLLDTNKLTAENKLTLNHVQKRSIFVTAVLSVLFLVGCQRPETGFLVKDGKAVYVTLHPAIGERPKTKPVQADAATFEQITPRKPKDRRSFKYAKDASQVFIGNRNRPYLIKDGDSKTFTVLTLDGKYAKDKSRVYYIGTPLKNADPSTFEVLEKPYAKDANNVYAGIIKMDGVDAATFRVLHPGSARFPALYNGPVQKSKDRELKRLKSGAQIYGWACDENACYYAENRIHAANPDTFQVLNSFYAKDDANVFYAKNGHASKVRGADAATFESSPSSVLRWQDKAGGFERGKPVRNTDTLGH